MAQVVCRLSNASTVINGVAFEKVEGHGMVSAEIEDEVARNFCLVPGFAVWEEPDGSSDGTDSDPADPAAEKPKKRGRPPKGDDASAPSGGDAPVST